MSHKDLPRDYSKWEVENMERAAAADRAHDAAIDARNLKKLSKKNEKTLNKLGYHTVEFTTRDGTYVNFVARKQ